MLLQNRLEIEQGSSKRSKVTIMIVEASGSVVPALRDHVPFAQYQVDQLNANFYLSIKALAASEIATWGMMVIGFGAFGVAARRRRMGMRAPSVG